MIQVYAPTTDVEEAKADQFYKELQHLEVTPKKLITFITGNWNAEVGNQKIIGIIGKFGFGVQNEVD